MLIGNGSRLASNPMRVMGGIQYLNDMNIPRPPAGALLNQWIGFRKTASCPQGANPHDAWIRSRTSGSLGSYGQIRSTSSLVAALTKGGNIGSGVSGAGRISSANMGVIVAFAADELIGLGTLDAAMVGSLSMAADLAGSGEVEAAIGLIAWCVSQIIGAGHADGSTMRGDSFMGANISSAGEALTAQSCAAAVWNALAAAYNEGGTMGNYLGALGAGANPWESEIDGGHTAQEVLRYILAFVSGTATGAGTTGVVFRSPNGTKNRISMTVDEQGNRSLVVLDGGDE